MHSKEMFGLEQENARLRESLERSQDDADVARKAAEEREAELRDENIELKSRIRSAVKQAYAGFADVAIEALEELTR